MSSEPAKTSDVATKFLFDNPLSERVWTSIVDNYTPLVIRRGLDLGLSIHDAMELGRRLFEAVANYFARNLLLDSSGSFYQLFFNIVDNELKQMVDAATTKQGVKSLLEEQLAGITKEQLQSARMTAKIQDVRDLRSRAVEIVQQQTEPEQWEIFKRLVIDKEPVAKLAEELAMPPSKIYLIKFAIRGRVLETLEFLKGFEPQAATVTVENRAESPSHLE